MIRQRSADGTRLPFGTDPSLAPLLPGRIGFTFGDQGPAEVRPDGMVIEVDGERHDVPIPESTTWALYLPVTQRVRDLAEDRAGRPSKLGETIAREMRSAGVELRGVARQTVLERLDAWAARYRVKLVVDVDDEGLDAQAVEKAADTARDAALKGLAAMVVQTLGLPGLAARADRLGRLVDGIDVDKAAPEVAELVGTIRGLLEGLQRPLTEDDLDTTEYEALKAYRRRNRDVMREEARQTVRVDGWEGDDHFDRLPDAQQAEALGHTIRLKELGPPKGAGSSPASG